jgi:hypothetical protein
VFVFSRFFTLTIIEGARITNVMMRYSMHIRSMLRYMSTSGSVSPSIPDPS